jgi:hypothetical protein
MTSYMHSPNGRRYVVGDTMRRGTVKRLSLKSEQDRKKTKHYLETQQRAEDLKRRRTTVSMDEILGIDCMIRSPEESRRRYDSPDGGDGCFGDDGDDGDSSAEWTDDEGERDSTTKGDETTPPSLESICATGMEKVKKLRARNEPSKHITDCIALQQNWEKCIRISTSEKSVRQPTKQFPDISTTPLYYCDCRRVLQTFTAIFLDRILQSIDICLIHPGCGEVKLWVCKKTCHRRLGWLGLITQGFLPSTPVRPHFIWRMNIFLFFHRMYMRAPSSKPAFCDSLRNMLMLSGAEEKVNIQKSEF